MLKSIVILENKTRNETILSNLNFVFFCISIIESMKARSWGTPKRSSKIVRNDFRFLPSSYFHRTGPNESIGTKIFIKFDRKLGQNQSRSSLIQKNAILTGLKSETEIFDRLE